MLPFDTMRTTPCTSQRTTNSKQNAKNGARLASRAATPANLSKNPTLLETSLGMRRGAGLLVMITPSLRPTQTGDTRSRAQECEITMKSHAHLKILASLAGRPFVGPH